MMKRTIISFFAALLLFAGCNNSTTNTTESKTVLIDTLQGKSLFGKDLISKQLNPVKDSLRINNFIKAEKVYKENPNNAEANIWYGRRMAYLGDYLKAIDIFTEGIEKFPDDVRFYRHRGHRYISIREYDKAIADFEKAAVMIEGKDDIIEPDGMPNIRNTPVSSLNTNIYYHLGLAYYLTGNMNLALSGFQRSLDASTNPDMIAASANWVYMIHRRMNKPDMAETVLEDITEDMDVFENMAYHKLLLFYKSILTEEDLQANTETVEYMNDAIAYGIGNWYFYNGDTARAREIFAGIMENGVWAGFAYLSAEADLYRMK